MKTESVKIDTKQNAGITKPNMDATEKINANIFTPKEQKIGVLRVMK